MSAIIFSLATFFSTYLGGLTAIRLKSKMHAIMAFAAGVILGVISFDIFPEIIEAVKVNNFEPTGIMLALVAGFLVFHILEKTILIYHCHEEDCQKHKHPHIGVLSALALIGHSFMDGLGIGLGFQISESVGIFVAIAVISHDFTDGLNTVTLALVHENKLKLAKKLLLADALAPILGAVSTLFFHVSEQVLVTYLGFFAGFLLYIGASDILPEAHSEKSSWNLIGLTVLGVALIFVITRLM